MVQISVSKPIADLLTPRVAKQIKITSVQSAEDEEIARFGIAEAVTLVGLIKGSLEVVKVGVELLRILRERHAATGKLQEAVVTLVGAKKDVTIRSSDDEAKLKKMLADQFSSA